MLYTHFLYFQIEIKHVYMTLEKISVFKNSDVPADINSAEFPMKLCSVTHFPISSVRHLNASEIVTENQPITKTRQLTLLQHLCSDLSHTYMYADLPERKFKLFLTQSTASPRRTFPSHARVLGQELWSI